jgi:hypothetical protein
LATGCLPGRVAVVQVNGCRHGPQQGKESPTMAMYLALLYYDRDQYWDQPPESEFSPEYTEFARRATAAGIMHGGEALHPVAMSTTITVSGGKGGEVMLIDGPYAEAKEVLGGYFVLETADLDEAIAWAAQIPAAWRGAKIELRPIAPVTHAL